MRILFLRVHLIVATLVKYLQKVTEKEPTKAVAKNKIGLAAGLSLKIHSKEQQRPVIEPQKLE
ncbi:MAG: hypothetical protein AAGI69_18275 [Cyanobacteria bacterium P01_H01_bin.21]